MKEKNENRFMVLALLLRSLAEDCSKESQRPKESQLFPQKLQLAWAKVLMNTSKQAWRW